MPKGPQSTHVLKIDRARPEYEWQTTLGGGTRIGLGTMTAQIQSLPAELGQPVAAINGDLWKTGQPFQGDPRSLQISRGELISAPTEHACFWRDAAGRFRATNVLSRFRVIWPDGKTTPFGLNEGRGDDDAVLYTARAGASTPTQGGRELVLERDGANDWLPLRPGLTFPARIKAVRQAGNTPLTSDTLVLSCGPQLLARIPTLMTGAAVKISTETVPDLRGVQTAIGGGPMLVQNGQPQPFTGRQPRHPRTAIGWSDSHFFFVVVDGRQRNLSIGMTYSELADYLAQLGCKEALNLDGGASSTMWLFGQVMNSPSAGRERAMANALVLVRKPSGGSDRK